jgi:lysozyme
MGGKSFSYRKTSYYVLFLFGICVAYFSFSIRPDKSGTIPVAVVERSSSDFFCDYIFLVRATISQQVGEVINKEGVELIESFEGFSSKPYKDVAGIWTIGVGSIYGVNGKRVKSDHHYITKEEALQLMKRDLKRTEVRITELVKVPVNQNQFAALCSFVYNVGSGAFQRSTARMKLNRGNYEGCADEFLRWKYAGKRAIPGLLRRRKAERELFLSEDEA